MIAENMQDHDKYQNVIDKIAKMDKDRSSHLSTAREVWTLIFNNDDNYPFVLRTVINVN